MAWFSSFPSSARSTTAGPQGSWGRREWLLALLLAAITLAAFSPVCGCDFVNFDDPEYVLHNPAVHCGVGAEGLRRAFTSITVANWHPLTLLSLQLDYQFFGLDPLGYHLTNLGLHVANTLVLFLALVRLTGQPWPSFLVAALFGVHPLHVESVAWVSERKDVLSTLFWMLALWAYAAYAARPRLGPYLLVLSALALGLLAKPMLVTLPCVLLLLDFWPLGRLGGLLEAGGLRKLGWLIVEKVPLLLLAAVSCAVTLQVQRGGGAVRDLEQFSLGLRLANAVRSYASYLGQTVWPYDLAVFYPYPDVRWTAAPVWASLLLLVCLSVLFVAVARKLPYLLVGWLWFLGTLVPVIGLVQVGLQAQADRYTYIPLVGVFLLFAWGLADLARAWHQERAVGMLAGLLLAWCLVLTWGQAHTWRNSVVLWRHALEVTPANDVAQGQLGLALLRQKKLDEAVVYLRQAARARPDVAVYRNHLGLALLGQGEIEASRAELEAALRLYPRYAAPHYNLGTGYARQARWPEAAAHFRRAVELEPEQAAYHEALADALAHIERSSSRGN
jgi:hypothetical protein